jgi:uncharacterized membrane protein YfcA
MFIILLLLGLLAGFVAGLLGVGGGIIFTPLLLFLFTTNNITDPVSFTIATSILCTLAASLSSTFWHIKRGNVFLKEGGLIGLAGFIGSFVGKEITLSEYYNQTEFTILFAGIMFYAAFNFIRTSRGKIQKNKSEKPEKNLVWWHYLVIGTGGGLVASMAGLGGGIVIVPILTMLFHKPFDKTVGISSMAIVVITFFTALNYALSDVATMSLSGYNLGYVDFGTALPLIAGSVVASQLGVKFAMKWNQKLLKRIFAVLIIVVAIRMLINIL